MSIRFREGKVVRADIGTHAVGSLEIAYDNIGTFGNVFGSFFPPSGQVARGLAFSTDKNKLWMSDAANKYFHEVGTAEHNILGSIPTPGLYPLGVAFASDKNRLWNCDDDEYIYEIGTTAGDVLGSFSTPDIAPMGLAYADDNHRLWYSDTNIPWNYIFEIGTTTGNAIGSFKGPLSTFIRDLAFVSATKKLLVAYRQGIIYEIGTTLGNVVGSFCMGVGTLGGLSFASDKKRCWVSQLGPANRHIFEIGTISRYSHIRDRAVDWRVITRKSIGSQHIQNDAVGSQHLADNAVSYAAQIKDNIIGFGELTSGLQGSLGAPGPDSIGTTELKEPGVGSQNIMNDAIGSQHIQNDAVGSQHLSAGFGIEAIAYVDQIKNDVIRQQHIYQWAVGTQEIANSAVYAPKIKNDAVGSQHLADNAVSYAAQIKDNIIGFGELTTGLQGTYMKKTGGTFIGSVVYSGAGKPPRLAVLTPGGAIVPDVRGATGTAVHNILYFSYYEQRFNPGTINSVWWEFQAPAYYDGGTVNFNVFWKGYPTTGTVLWRIATLGRTTNEAFYTAPTTLGSKCTNTYGSGIVNKSIITGKPDFVANELAVIRLSRIGYNATDTLAGSASLLMLGIDYKAVK